MIERKFIAEKIKEFQIEEYISNNIPNIGHSHTKLQRTPLGEKITIYAARPGLVVGRSGENIKKLTKNLKKKFGLENPQIEISEVENIYLNANIVAESIASALERFGSQRFKGIGHKTMSDVMAAGARGIEIVLSGKIPGARAKSWRFYVGYLKKCGNIAITGVDAACASAQLKSGVIGVRVKIMQPNIILPDKIDLLPVVDIKPEEAKDKKEEKKGEEKIEVKAEEKPSAKEAKPKRKKSEEKKPSARKPKKEAKEKSKEGAISQ